MELKKADLDEATQELQKVRELLVADRIVLDQAMASARAQDHDIQLQLSEIKMREQEVTQKMEELRERETALDTRYHEVMELEKGVHVEETKHRLEYQRITELKEEVQQATKEMEGTLGD